MLGPGTQKRIKCVLLSSVEFIMGLDDRRKGFCLLVRESWVYSFSKEGCDREEWKMRVCGLKVCRSQDKCVMVSVHASFSSRVASSLLLSAGGTVKR